MDDTTQKGEIREKVGNTIYSQDGNVANIIKYALCGAGFDVIIRHKVEPNTNIYTGEEIEVFRKII